MKPFVIVNIAGRYYVRIRSGTGSWRVWSTWATSKKEAEKRARQMLALEASPIRRDHERASEAFLQAAGKLADLPLRKLTADHAHKIMEKLVNG